MFCTRRANQGGVVIIMTLVILVIGAVLAVTFATSMRLEEKSAVAFKKEGKVSNIAQAGYEYALAILRKDKDEEVTMTRPYDALNEDWRADFSPVGDEVNPAQNLVDLDGVDNNGVLVGGARYDARWSYLHADADPELEIIGRFAVLIVDEASKINLHASGSGTQNQGWTPFEIDLTNLQDSQGNPLFTAVTATRLINYRQGDKTGGENVRYPGNQNTDDDNDNIPLGNDGIDNNGNTEIDEINEGIDEPDEYISSFPYGSGDEADFALKMVDELFKINGINKEKMRICKNFTTIDAQDRAGYWNGSAWQNRININAVSSANVGALYGLMTDAGISPENAARRTTNIIDYADRDNVPTAILTTEPKTYLGIEGLQINEIMARVHPDMLAGHKDALYLDNRVHWQIWDDPDSFTGDGWDNTTGLAVGDDDGVTSTWTWPWDNGTYDIYIYRDSGGVGENFNYVFQKDESGEIPGFADFDSSDPYLVNGVTVSNGKIKLTLTATTAEWKSRFDHIGVFAGEYVELVNLSSQPITINHDWGINVGGDIVIDTETKTAKIDSSNPGNTYQFTWFEGGATEFTIPGSPGWPDYNYFIAADSRYALDYKHAYDATRKDGIWGTEGHGGNEPGYLAVIGDLDLDDGGCKNISLVREVNGEQIVVDFVPNETNAPDFGTFYWHQDSSLPEEDKSFERLEAIDDTSSWAVTTENWGQGTPGGKNLVTTDDPDPDGLIKNYPFPSPGFIMDVYTGTDKDTKITHTDVRDFIQKLTTAYHRLEIENSDSPPSWTTDTGLDGTVRYLSPDANSNAVLSWGTGDNPKLHIPDGSYNLFIAGDIGGKFECPSGETRAMRPDGLAYCGTADITGRSLTMEEICGNGTNSYSLDYILLIPNKDSPPSIGKININTASEQVLNALPSVVDIGAQIIAYRNGVDGPFENIGEYLSIAVDPAQLKQNYQKQANLITVRSDIFEIIVLGQAIDDLVNVGEFEHPEIVGINRVSDEIVGQVKIRAIVDRSVDPPKLLYFRRELK